MPSPLTSLSPDEQYLYGSLAADPLSHLSPMLADAAEDRTQHRRAELLRLQARLPLLELLRGKALTEEESAEVAARIRALLLTQEPASAVAERELAAALGTPLRGDAMLALLGPEGNLDAERLREQYDFQGVLLASLGLLECRGDQAGITGIDSRFYPLPSLEDIHQRLATPALRRKVAQGFDQLLLVPFALPLKRLIEAWKRNLVRNEHLLQSHGGLDRERPMWVGDGFDSDDLIYSPERFDSNHGGRTKAQVLASDPASAWLVLLTEGALTELPLAGQGQTIGGRKQLEAGRPPREYLAEAPHDEAGWTPETYVAAFLTTLERAGQVLDSNAASYLTGSYLPAPGYVPGAYWLPEDRQACLDRNRPGFGEPNFGSRAAVRVV